jgi:glycosyltransferase involved in cell wall biosynthesis
MAKILFVVHRYVPFEGGSEFFVRDMAEECLRRKHDVTVLAHEHKGDQNGVKVTNDYQALVQKWDLIIIHGGDVISQNIAHQNAYIINKVSPVAYMLIKPSGRDVCVNGLKHHKFLTYSTSADIEFLKNMGIWAKARRIRHGVVPEKTIRTKNIRTDQKKIFVSAGGFFPHKAMLPLAEAFDIYDAELHLYGYFEGSRPIETYNVKVFFGEPKDKVMQAIADADAYIMNSYEEGFGLVLLEAMMNKTSWFARNIAGAKDMARYGNIYETEEELIKKLRTFEPNIRQIEDAYNYAMANHTIHDTVNDIEDLLLETM